MPARLAARRINNAKKIGRRPESRAEQVAVIDKHDLARPGPGSIVKYNGKQWHPGPGGSLRTSRNSAHGEFRDMYARAPRRV